MSMSGDGIPFAAAANDNTPSSSAYPDEQVKICVKSQDQSRLFFQLKRDSKLQKVFQAYCQKKALELETIQFIYKGKRISGNQTPRQLKMKQQCSIDAFMHQHGGGAEEPEA